MEIVREVNRIFILGKPGAGKTTFMKHLTLEAINGTIERTPIFVNLKDFSESGLSLLDFIAHQFDICGFPDALPFIKAILILLVCVQICKLPVLRWLSAYSEANTNDTETR